jgi:hypothetical protein
MTEIKLISHTIGYDPHSLFPVPINGTTVSQLSDFSPNSRGILAQPSFYVCWHQLSSLSHEIAHLLFIPPTTLLWAQLSSHLVGAQTWALPTPVHLLLWDQFSLTYLLLCHLLTPKKGYVFLFLHIKIPVRCQDFPYVLHPTQIQQC